MSEKPRILVVDDEDIVRESLYHWFTEDGYIRSIGVKPEMAALIFAQADGQVGEPIEVKDRGWALFKVEEREAAVF